MRLLFCLPITACILSAQATPPAATQGKWAQFGTPSAPSSSKTIPLPKVMHFCAQHCLTFKLENGQLINYTNLDGQSNEKRVFAVESFTPDNVVINRTDTGSNPLAVIYTGKTGDTGNSLSGQGWKITWGAALDSIPGSDEERALLAQPTIPYGPSSMAPAKEAYEHGVQAITAKKADIGTCWLRLAAKQGDADSQGLLSLVLYRGRGVPLTRTEAFDWAQKAASQGEYVGELSLSLMYETGEGAPKDAKKAEYWEAKGEKDKVAYQQAVQAAQEQRQEQISRNQVQSGLLMLNFLLGAFSSDSSGGSGSRGDGLDRYNSLKESCSAGFSSSCGLIGRQAPE